jgi:hypothetical protein
MISWMQFVTDYCHQSCQWSEHTATDCNCQLTQLSTRSGHIPIAKVLLNQIPWCPTGPDTLMSYWIRYPDVLLNQIPWCPTGPDILMSYWTRYPDVLLDQIPWCPSGSNSLTFHSLPYFDTVSSRNELCMLNRTTNWTVSMFSLESWIEPPVHNTHRLHTTATFWLSGFASQQPPNPLKVNPLLNSHRSISSRQA